MRPDRERKVIERFRSQMRRHLPEFEPADLDEDGDVDIEEPSPARRFFRRPNSPDLTFYVELQIDPRDDKFSVNLTWMRTPRHPRYATPGTPASAPNADGLSISIGLLWQPSMHQWKVKYSPSSGELAAWSAMHPEPADLAASEEDLKVFVRVDDAIDKVRTLGLDYFARVASRFTTPIH